MAQHEVKFDVPFRPLGNADVRFIVYQNGAKFGELHISKGAVVWVGKDRTYGRRLNWGQISDVFEERGSKRRP